MESKQSSKAVNLLTRAVDSRVKGYASQLVQTLTLVASSPAKHKILMRAYSRSKSDAKLLDHFESASVASTEVTNLCEEMSYLQPKIVEVDEVQVKRAPLIVPKLCLKVAAEERNVSYRKERSTSKTRLAPPSFYKPVLSKESSKAAKSMKHSMSTLYLDNIEADFSIEGKTRGLSLGQMRVRSTAVSRATTPSRSAQKAIKRPDSAHNLRKGYNKTKEEVLKRNFTLNVLKGNVQPKTFENHRLETASRVRGSHQTVPQEAELSEILAKVTVRRLQEVKDSLHFSTEATEVGLGLLILFADIDSSIEVTCSHRVMKSRRWEQVGNYFSIPGHVVSVCRRFIPSVKKGVVSVSKAYTDAVKQASMHLSQAKRIKDPASACAMLFNFLVAAIHFFEAWQQS